MNSGAGRGAVELCRTASRLREMADEIDRMASGNEPRAAAVIAADVIDLGHVLFRAYARRGLRIRRTLGDYFDASLFADPARDILYDLFVAAEDGVDVDLDRCAAVAAIPPTTARRWLDRLCRQGIVELVGDEADGRRPLVRLAPAARERMRAYLAAAYSIPLSLDRPG